MVSRDVNEVHECIFNKGLPSFDLLLGSVEDL